MTQQIRVVLTGDSASLEAAGARSARTLEDLVRASGNSQRSMGQLNGVTASTQRQMQMLAPQITDVVTQLAGGQNPLLVMIQQGGQLRDVFGGFTPALRAIGSLFTVTRVAVGGLAASVGLLAMAYLEGQRQSERFRDITALTGNAAGISQGQFNALIGRVADAARVAPGAAREIAEALLASGQIGGRAMEAMGTAIARVATVSGKANKDVSAEFSSMARDTAAWAIKYNETANIFTAADIRRMRSMQAAGDVQGAVILASNKVTESLKDQARNLGFLERAINLVKEAWGGLSNAATNWGRNDTTETRLSNLSSMLDREREALSFAKERPAGRSQEIAGRQVAIEKIQAEMAALRENIKLERQAGEARSAAAQTNREEIARETSSYAERASGLLSAQLQTQFELKQAAAERDRSALDQSFAQEILSAQGYAVARYQIDAQSIKDRAALIDAEVALVRKKPLTGTQGEIAEQREAQKQRIVELERQRIGLQTQLDQLNDKRVRGEIKPPTDSLGNFISEQLGAQSVRDQGKVDEYQRDINAANTQAREMREQLVEQAARTNASLITDTARRADVELAIERSTIQHRIDLLKQGGADVRELEDSLATYMVARRAEATEALKPQWQRMIEGWRDTNRLMRESSESFQTAWLQSGEQAWVQFAQTGKISARSLIDTVIAELARLEFRRSIAPAFSSLGTSLFSAIFGSSSAGGAGTVSGGSGLKANALGGAYDGARGLSSYSSTIVSRPTVFAFARGAGLMGEAGYEGILPLQRNSRGQLGVMAAGGGQSPVWEINLIGAPAETAVSTKSDGRGGGQVLIDLRESIKREVKGDLFTDLARGGNFSRAVNAATGTQRPTPART